jgi:hypothetical protein
MPERLHLNRLQHVVEYAGRMPAMFRGRRIGKKHFGLAVATALGMTLATPACSKPAPAPVWAQFHTPQAVTIQGYDGHAMEPFLSRDGKQLFFNNRNDPADQTDIHWAERIDDLTFRYRGRIDAANSLDLDGVPTLSRDGRFCFISTRAYAATLATVHCGTWRDGQLLGVRLQPEVSAHVPGRLIFDVEIDAGGQRLIVADGRFTGGPVPASADLRQAVWVDGAFRLQPAADPLFAAVNTKKALEYAAAISSDGRELAFSRIEGKAPFLRFSVWIARRKTVDGPFEAPVRIEAIKGVAEAPTFSPGDDALYYHRRAGDRYSIWRVTR